MAKLTLNDIQSNFQSTSQLNANFDLIEAALENTLSRNGATPNAMGADHDMNGHKVINIAAPTSGTDAARLTDITSAFSTPFDNTQNAVSTIVTLRSLMPTAEGQPVAVLGYYEAGDGGGGPIRIGKAAPAGGLTDNGGSIIKPLGVVGDAIAEGSLYWGWEWSGTVNVRWFGAKGDNTTDDTNSFRAAASTGKPIYIPAGDFLVTQSINPNTNDSSQFYGDPVAKGYGGNSSKLRFDDNLLGNTDSCIYGPTSLRDLAIIGTSKKAIGVEFRNRNGIAGAFGSYSASNIWVSGCYKAFTFDSMYSNRFEGLNAYQNVHGFWLVPVLSAGDSGYFTTTVFIDCSSNQNAGLSWNVAPPVKSPNLTFINCSFEGASTTETHIAKISNTVEPFYMLNPYVEGGGGTTASVLINGAGLVDGMYDNSTGGIDLGSGTASLTFRRYRATSASFGFKGGSLNARINIEDSALNRMPDAISGGRFQGVIAPGSNKRWDFHRETASDKSFPADGAPADLISLDVDTATSNHMTLRIPFSASLTVAGVSRQGFSGELIVNYLSVSSDAGSSQLSVVGLVKSNYSGTLDDPIFTVSAAGSLLTIKCAVTTTLGSATVGFRYQVTNVSSGSNNRFPVINTL